MVSLIPLPELNKKRHKMKYQNLRQSSRLFLKETLRSMRLDLELENHQALITRHHAQSF